MDWNTFISTNPYLPGIITVGIGLVFFVLGVSRHHKRVETKLEEIATLLKTPTQVAAIKRDAS